MEEKPAAEDEAPAHSEPKMPKWARTPFDDFGDQAIEIGDVLHLACDGIAMLRGRPKALEVLMKVKRDMSEHGEDSKSIPTEDQIEVARRQAELAQKEVDKSFPLLHAQAAISLWGSLEALIKNFLAAWIQNEPSARQAEAMRRLKVPLWQYDQMDAEERSFYAVDLLEREVNAPLREGATRIEVLLDVFGFGGPVPERIRRDLYELNHLRHVLVHRRGLADRRLVDACPWLRLDVGQPVVVSHENFGRYMMSATEYFFTVYNRVRRRYGVPPMRPFDKEAENDEVS